MLKKTAVMLLALVSLFVVCAVPVSAANSSNYIDTGTIYMPEFSKQSGFCFTDWYQQVPYTKCDGYLDFSNAVYPEYGDFLGYILEIPTDRIVVGDGDEYILDFTIDFYTPLAFMLSTDSSAISMGLMSGDDYTLSYDVTPTTSSRLYEFMSYPSLKRQQLHFKVRITGNGECVLQGISFNFYLYKSRHDRDYLYIYDTTSYKIFGGNRYFIDQMKELADTNEKLDDLNDKQDETNNKLDEIIDQPEQEKAEAGGTGNDAIDGLTNAIPSDNEGVINAFGGLVESMSYSGTDCKWTFPAIYLPKIDGVMERMQLTDEKPIDFTEWINAIPSDILEVVRILGTVALILYCFKELYGLIKYILTMKGGGAANE